MKRYIVISVLIILCVINLTSCNSSEIVIDDSYKLEESIDKLELAITEEYNLDEFKLCRIFVFPKKGRLMLKPCVVSVYGIYTSGDETMIWHKSYDITKDNAKTLTSASDEITYLLYNNVEKLDGTVNETSPIKTDTPGWVIEGVYNIIF